MKFRTQPCALRGEIVKQSAFTTRPGGGSSTAKSLASRLPEADSSAEQAANALRESLANHRHWVKLTKRGENALGRVPIPERNADSRFSYAFERGKRCRNDLVCVSAGD